MTGTERNAANYCYQAFLNSDTKAEAHSYYAAYLLLSDRENRARFAPVRNDSSDLRRKPRTRHCGRFTMQGANAKEMKYVRLNCNCWDCSYCAKRKATKYRNNIMREAERLKLCRMATFTLDPKIPCVDRLTGEQVSPVRYIKAVWAKVRAQMKKRYGQAPKYICVMEFQEETKMPHLHVLLDRYMEQKWLQRVWMQAGGGEHVDIRRKKNKAGEQMISDQFISAARYVSKYLTKELLMSAPKRSRRVTVAHGVSLNDKKKSKTHTWALIRESIFVMFARLAKCAKEITHGPDDVLQSFAVPITATA